MCQICQNCKHYVSLTLGRVGAACPAINEDIGYCYLDLEAGEPFIRKGINYCDDWEFAETNTIRE